MENVCCENPFPLQLKTPDGYNLLNGDGILDLSNPDRNLDREQVVGATNSINRMINELRPTVGSKYSYALFQEQFPILADRVNRGPLFTAEVAIFANDYQVNLNNMASTFGSYSIGETLPTPLQDYLGNLNTFFTNNIGASLSGGFCAAFTNIFEKITLLINLVRTVEGFINDLKNANAEDIILGILEAVFGPLINIILSIVKTIEALAKAFLNAVKSIEEGMKQVVADIEEGASAVSQAIKRRINDVKQFFSDDNMTSLKEYIEKMITAASSAFENLDPWIIGMLMYRFCQLTNALQAFMESPVKGLQEFAKGMVKSQIVMSNISQIRQKEAVSANAVRFDDNEKRTARREAAIAMNTAAQSPQAIVELAKGNETALRARIESATETQSLNITTHPIYGSDAESLVPQALNNLSQLFSRGVQSFNAGTVNWFDTVEIKPYVVLSDFTPQEIADLNKLQQPFSGGVPPKIIFLGPIFNVTQRKDGFETNNQGPGWLEVNDSVWIKMLRVYDQIGYPQIVSDGFNPNHPELSTGNAVTVVARGENSILYLIIAASRAGFSEIHVKSYNEVILVDSGTLKGTLDSSLGSLLQTTYIEAALEKHRKSEWCLASGGLPIDQINSSRIINPQAIS